MIQAIIFDMDGVLIDSEPIWRAAEVEVFGAYGIGITEEMCYQTTGMRVDEVVRYWSERLGDPENDPLEEITDRMVDRVIEMIGDRGRPMAGLEIALAGAEAAGVPLAVCSSSPRRLIEAVMQKFGIREHFKVIRSAEFEAYGKPHPAVYIHTAEDLGVRPEDCLAIEDSVNGVLSAKSAKMKVIAVPEGPAFKDPRYAIADRKVRTLGEIPAVLSELFA